jgi:hypothetical protein
MPALLLQKRIVINCRKDVGRTDECMCTCVGVLLYIHVNQKVYKSIFIFRVGMYVLSIHNYRTYIIRWYIHIMAPSKLLQNT